VLGGGVLGVLVELPMLPDVLPAAPVLDPY
jgi:hypothetical protein